MAATPHSWWISLIRSLHDCGSVANRPRPFALPRDEGTKGDQETPETQFGKANTIQTNILRRLACSDKSRSLASALIGANPRIGSNHRFVGREQPKALCLSHRHDDTLDDGQLHFVTRSHAPDYAVRA
jgi:hypothetical protein